MTLQKFLGLLGFVPPKSTLVFLLGAILSRNVCVKHFKMKCLFSEMCVADNFWYTHFRKEFPLGESYCRELSKSLNFCSVAFLSSSFSDVELRSFEILVACDHLHNNVEFYSTQ